MQCFSCFCNLIRRTTTTSKTCWPATAEAGKKPNPFNRTFLRKYLIQFGVLWPKNSIYQQLFRSLARRINRKLTENHSKRVPRDRYILWSSLLYFTSPNNHRTRLMCLLGRIRCSSNATAFLYTIGLHWRPSDRGTLQLVCVLSFKSAVVVWIYQSRVPKNQGFVFQKNTKDCSKWRHFSVENEWKTDYCLNSVKTQ